MAAAAPLSVVLIGWTGCAERYLKKYQDAWREVLPKDGDTKLVLDHCKMGVTEAWSPARFASIAAQLHDELMLASSGGGGDRAAVEPPPRKKKLIIHMFSNGGAFLYAALARHIHSIGSPLRFDALLFDSCPGSFRELRLGFNFLWSSQPSPVARCAIVVLSPLLVAAAAIGYLASLRWSEAHGWTDVQSRYEESVLLYARETHEAPPPLRALFLYSADDALIPSVSVEEAMGHFRQAGATVASKRWPSSTHVEHLRTDADGYKGELRKLVSAL